MIFDLHNDLLTATDKHGEKQPVFNPDTVYAVWTTGLESPAAFIVSVKQRGVRLTAVEDLGFVTDIDCGAELLGQLKPVYASLTWNNENAFAGGALSDLGLTFKGREMIARLESAGILPDVAHLSRPAFFEVAEAAKGPIICSHTCFDGVYGHMRNLTDGQVKTIISKGGLIGLCLVSAFMGKPRAVADDFGRQIDYFTQRFGGDNLALGTDFNGCDDPALEDYSAFKQVAEKLLRLGYSQNSIDKIFYLNACNFLTKKQI